MKRFSELGVKQDDERKVFNCTQVSISDVINCEIEVLDFIQGVKTKHGDGRYLIHFKHEGIEGKFFSNAANLKNALDQISKDDFPFTTVIRAIKCGNGKMYQFT